MSRGAASGHLGWAALVALAGALSGCVDNTNLNATGPQSIQIKLSSPDAAHLGSPGSPVQVSQVVFDAQMIGPDGGPWKADTDAQVYLAFSGVKVGKATNCGGGIVDVPIATVQIRGGVAKNVTVPVADAYGAVTLWVEDPVSHALGTSSVIWFPQPLLPQILAPVDATATTATWCSPWEGRNILANQASGTGKLVVTSVFTGAYVVADTGAMYDPVAKTGGYNHLYVFTFGRPPADAVPGAVLEQVSGNISKFNGFTELNFPLQSFTGEVIAPPAPLPATVADLADTAKALRLDAQTVTVTGSVCTIAPNDPQWVKYNTFVLDFDGSGTCDSMANFSVALPGKTLGSFDPVKEQAPMAGMPGRTMDITGMLQNSSGQNPACKGIGNGLDVPCDVDADCVAAGNKLGAADACGAKLLKATCAEKICRRGVFNFWSVLPRTPADIVFH